MLVQIEGFSAENDELLKIAYHIRNVVFVQEQNVDKNIEYDGLDFDATHYLVYVNEKPAATARWRETESGIKLERYAVLKNYRGKGLGGLLLRFMLEEVIPSGKEIYLHAQSAASKFYSCHGFKTEGKKFYEADIEHFKMVYRKQKSPA